MDDEESNCGNCYFWHGFVNGGIGSCRVRAPVVTGPPATQRDMGIETCRPEAVLAVTHFPLTSKHQWCGEFRHKGRMP